MILKEFECPFVGRDSPRFAVERRRKERFSTLFFFYTLACRRFIQPVGEQKKKDKSALFFSLLLSAFYVLVLTPFSPLTPFETEKSVAFFFFCTFPLLFCLSVLFFSKQNGKRYRNVEK